MEKSVQVEKEAGLVVKKGNKDVKKYKEKYKEGRGEEGRNNREEIE